MLALTITAGILPGLNQVQAQGTLTSGIINIAFYNSSVSGQQVASGAAVIGNSGDYWNRLDVTTPTVGIGNLTNNSGNATSVGFGAGGGSQTTLSNPTGAYSFLFQTGFDSFPMDFVGLADNTQYELVVYQPLSTTTIVNGVSFSSTSPTGPFNSLVSGIGYSTGIVTSDSSGDLELNFHIGSAQPFISALQLTPEPTPEPTTLALASLGAASLLAFRRRK